MVPVRLPSLSIPGNRVAPEIRVRDTPRSGALPLRPLTTGELLDAAVALLRAQAAPLLVMGFALALAEQIVLFVLRQQADVAYAVFPREGKFGWFLLLYTVGFGTEAL